MEYEIYENYLIYFSDKLCFFSHSEDSLDSNELDLNTGEVIGKHFFLIAC